MFVGRVIGTVWSTVKWPQVQGLKLLLVRPYHLADLADSSATAGRESASAADAASPSPRGGPDCEAVVCVDLLDAGVGDDVVVAFGHAARVAAQSGSEGGGEGGGKDPGLSSSHFPSPGSRKTRESQGGGPATSLGLGSAVGSTPVPPVLTVPTVPIDAAIVAIVDRIAVARPST